MLKNEILTILLKCLTYYFFMLYYNVIIYGGNNYEFN